MNEHSAEYLTPQDEKIEIRKTVIESLASENYSKSEIDRFVKNAVDPLLENNDLETDEDTETFNSNLKRIIGNFEKEQTNNKSTPEVKEVSDDIETVVGKIRSDLTNKGYEDTEVNRLINKALRPLIKKSDFSDTDEFARIISNFSKEQDKKLAQQVNKGTPEKDVEINKEVETTEENPTNLISEFPGLIKNYREQKRRLLGMKIPKAGPERVFSSRSFREGLLLMVNTGRVEGYQTDPAIKGKIDRILKIVNYVPDTGLTNEEVSQLESLIYDVASHENPIHKKIEENASLRAKEVVEKLPALAEIPKKKRGFFSRIARSFMLTLPLVVPGSSLDNNDGLNTIHAMTKTPVAISGNGLTPDSAPKTSYTDDAVRSKVMKTPALHAVENSTPDTTSGIDTFTPVTENFEIVPSKNNPKSYATYNDSEDVSPTGPEYAEQETSVEKQVIEYTFEKGDKVNTVSEAALEMWKINSSVIDKSVTQSSFLSAMWGVISDLEKDSNLAKQVTEDMSMDSGDIHHVHSGETIELQAFYELINKKLS